MVKQQSKVAGDGGRGASPYGGGGKESGRMVESVNHLITFESALSSAPASCDGKCMVCTLQIDE